MRPDEALPGTLAKKGYAGDIEYIQKADIASFKGLI
jgi:hypothetical protein